MTNQLVYYLEGSSEPQAMPDVVPGSQGAWPGYVIQRHGLRPTDIPDCVFPGHVIALERNPKPFRATWRDDGVERYADCVRGVVLVRSQQPLRSMRLTGVQQSVMLCIDPQAMELALPEPFRARPVELRPRSIGCDAVVNHLMATLEAELKAKAPGGQLVLTSLGNALALYLAVHYASHPPALPVVPGGLARDRLSRVLEYIDAHLMDDLGVDELAGIACLSSYHFGRMFKNSTGRSVHQFVLHRRMEQARALLRRKDLTVMEIAAAVGFGSQSRFTTAFRRAIGVPPGAWRRNFGCFRD